MATVAVPRSPVAPLKQNWILGSWADAFFIIGTPVFVLPVILLLFFTGGELLVWSTFAVVNTSHHLPTFLRIYGDRDLLSRFRWSLLLAPIIPFTCCMTAVVFLIRSGSSMNNLLYLYTIVTVWDLWHFLMQHYGFMRIYDRHNRAPRKIASRMDLCLCGAWFIYIMLATMAWLPNLLYQLAIDCGVPLLKFPGLRVRGRLSVVGPGSRGPGNGQVLFLPALVSAECVFYQLCQDCPHGSNVWHDVPDVCSTWCHGLVY